MKLIYDTNIVLDVMLKRDPYYTDSAVALNLSEQGDVEGAIRLFEEYLPTLQSGDRRYSIVASTLAFFYWKSGQPQQQEHYLLLSAISDLQGAILENNALRELSSILMERGVYERAYRYLSRASNDA